MPLKSQQIERDYFHYWHFNNILERTKLQEAYDHRERLLGRTNLFENTISETFNQNKDSSRVSNNTFADSHDITNQKGKFYQLHRMITITF